jgi:hypothetical protein
MADSDDRPDSTKPPEPAVPEKVWLPPRLRDRLESARAEEKYDGPKESPLVPILGFGIIALVAGGIWWLIAANVARQKAEAAAVAAETARVAKAEADSLAKIRMDDSLRMVARADSIKAFEALPQWKKNKILGISSPDQPDLEESGSFTIDAGSFLFEDPANRLVAALQGKAKDVRVETVTEGGSTSYHVYVGKFGVRGAAQKAADDLLTKGLAEQASVVKLGK